nr:hypothetical protein [Sphingomonas horti]
MIAGATLVATASPAEAQYRGRYYGHHRGDRTALAIGAGALGLAVGAALASNSRRGYYDGYGGGYYGRPYSYNYGYYGRPYSGYGYGSYYAPRRCWTERQWDDWRGRWRRVRVCGRY